MESGDIKDSQVTASSVKNDYRQPFSARLYNPYGDWKPVNDSYGEWLQIDFIDQVAVTKVATQGRGSRSGIYEKWVTSYKLSFSKDTTSWEFFKENGQEKVCTHVV